MHDLVRESSRNLLEEFEDPSDLLERPNGKNSTVSHVRHGGLKVFALWDPSGWRVPWASMQASVMIVKLRFVCGRVQENVRTTCCGLDAPKKAGEIIDIIPQVAK